MKDMSRIAVFLGMVVLASIAQAGTVTWDGGGGNDFWQTDSNWVGDTKPGANDILVFAGTIRTVTTNNFAADTLFDGIQFPNTVAGQGFSLGGNTIGLLGDITNSAAASNITDTIALDMRLFAGQRFFALGSNHNLTVSGSVSGDGRLLKVGEGTLRLSASNSYSGGTHGYGGTAIGDNFSGSAPHEGGTLIISDNNALGTRFATFEKGGTLSLGVDGMNVPNGFLFSNWGGGEKVIELDLAGTNSGTFAGNMDYRFGDGGAIKYNVGNHDTLTLSGNGYSGAGVAGFTKVGSGTLVITGTNTFKNRTAINSGTLQLGDGGGTGTLPATQRIVNDSTLVFNRSNVVTQGVDFGGPINGSGQIYHINSTGTVVLADANEYTGGTKIGSLGLDRDGGTIRVMHNNALGSGGVIFEHGGCLALGTNGLTVANFIGLYNWGGGARTNRFDVEGTNSATMSGSMDIRYTAGRGFVTDVGADDTLTYSGKLYSGAGGSAGLTKSGEGTLILTASNTYWAGTTVDGGTLLVNNASGSGTGTGAVNVNDGGALGGIGSVAGAVSVASGGRLAAGTGGAGTLTLEGGLTLDDGTGLSVVLDEDGAVGSIEVTGGVFSGAATGSVTVDIEIVAFPRGGQYTILDWSSVPGYSVDIEDFVISEPYKETFQLRVVGKSLVLSRGATVLIIR